MIDLHEGILAEFVAQAGLGLVRRVRKPLVLWNIEDPSALQQRKERWRHPPTPAWRQAAEKLRAKSKARWSDPNYRAEQLARMAEWRSRRERT